MGWLFPLIGLSIGLLLLAGFIEFGRRWRRRRQRILWEDALKQICSAEHEGRTVTCVELSGRLGLSPASTLRLTQDLEFAGYVRSHAGVLELTKTGEHLGLHVLRGHRLWERYLSDDGQLPLDRLHGAAERAEHHLVADELTALADHLGHPRTDPHGDLIPTAAGELPPQQRTPLTDWPPDRLAVVVHVEDEPRQVLREALRAGLRPGTVLRVIERNAKAVICETSAGQCTLTPAVAANIDVRPAVVGEELGKPLATLAGLRLGEEAEVLALSERCTGLGRRRLLDLGFTAGARVRAVLANLDDAAHAYEIRGTMIALRKEQAEQILIRPLAAHRRETRIKAGETMIGTLFHSPCRDCLLHQSYVVHPDDVGGRQYTVALAGNPNTGKSTVFNALTGLRQHTGNWPGKTVNRAEGSFVRDGITYRLIDLPGTYSLLSASTDEEIARDFILFGQPDCTVVVVDATALERNLNLVFQVMEITDKVVVCVNLMDEARRKGIEVNTDQLSKEIGVPAVGTAARTGEGLRELVRTIAGVIDGRVPTSPKLPAPPTAAKNLVDELVPKISGAVSRSAQRALDRL